LPVVRRSMSFILLLLSRKPKSTQILVRRPPLQVKIARNSIP